MTDTFSYAAAPQCGNFTCGKTISTSAAPEWIITGLHWVMGIALVLMLLYLILGVFFQATAGPNAEAQDKAAQAISGAIIGMVLIVVAYALVLLVIDWLTGQPLGFF